MKKEALEYEDKTFRKYEPAISKDRTGRTVIIRKCEELVDGRWEPFISIHYPERRPK